MLKKKMLLSLGFSVFLPPLVSCLSSNEIDLQGNTYSSASTSAGPVRSEVVKKTIAQGGDRWTSDEGLERFVSGEFLTDSGKVMTPDSFSVMLKEKSEQLVDNVLESIKITRANSNAEDKVSRLTEAQEAGFKMLEDFVKKSRGMLPAFFGQPQNPENEDRLTELKKLFYTFTSYSAKSEAESTRQDIKNLLIKDGLMSVVSFLNRYEETIQDPLHKALFLLRCAQLRGFGGEGRDVFFIQTPLVNCPVFNNDENKLKIVQLLEGARMSLRDVPESRRISLNHVALPIEPFFSNSTPYSPGLLRGLIDYSLFRFHRRAHHQVEALDQLRKTWASINYAWENDFAPRQSPTEKLYESVRLKFLKAMQYRGLFVAIGDKFTDSDIEDSYTVAKVENVDLLKNISFEVKKIVSRKEYLDIKGFEEDKYEGDEKAKVAAREEFFASLAPDKQEKMKEKAKFLGLLGQVTYQLARVMREPTDKKVYLEKDLKKFKEAAALVEIPEDLADLNFGDNDRFDWIKSITAELEDVNLAKDPQGLARVSVGHNYTLSWAEPVMAQLNANRKGGNFNSELLASNG